MRFPRLLQVSRYIQFHVDVDKKLIKIPTVIHFSDGEAMNAVQVLLCPKFSKEKLEALSTYEVLEIIRIFKILTFVYGIKTKTTA